MLNFTGPRNWLIGPQAATGAGSPALAGRFIIFDSTAGAYRLTIDPTGLVNVTGPLSVFGGMSGSTIHTTGNINSDTDIGCRGLYCSYVNSSGNCDIAGYTTLFDLRVNNNCSVPNGWVSAGSYIQSGSWLQCAADFYCNGPLWARSNLTCNGRAALWQTDFGQSQSNRTGFFDGSNGTLGCWTISSQNTANTGINLYGGLVVWTASGQLDAFWVHGGCELLAGDLRCLNNDHNPNGGGTGWFYTVNCINAAQSAGIATYGADGLGIRPADNRYSSGVSGQAWAQVASYWMNTVSDARLKQDIDRPPEGALAAVAALSPVQYRWRKSEPGDDPLQREISETGPRLHRGFLAQDVREVLGEEFGGWSEENGVQGLDYNELTAVLWQAVQELAARVEALEGVR